MTMKPFLNMTTARTSPDNTSAEVIIAEMHKFLHKPTDYPLYETCDLMRRALNVLEEMA